MGSLAIEAAYDGTLLEEIPLQTKAEALAMMDAAHAAYADRSRWLEPHERIAILERMAEKVSARSEELALQAAREGGKPLLDSRVELARAVEGIQAAIEAVRGLGGVEIPMRLSAGSAGRMAYTHREPRGVVLAISAFNHPFNLIIHQVVTAIAAGCPVLVKPAPTTPLSCRSLVEIAHASGLPKELCQFVFCDNDVAEALVTDTRMAFLTFIGSAKVGWFLRSKLPPGAACALEHGGVAPAVVEATADLADALPLLTKGGFYHAGQVCVSVQRIYVDRKIADAFLDPFVEAAERLVVGDPTDAKTEVGPLILPREVDRVDEWVREAIDGGAELRCGGRKISDYVYAPTVLVDPPDDARVTTHEVFGPVVCVYRYDDLEDAVRRANAPDSFFQSSVFTQRLDVALDLSRRLNGMAVMVNDHTAFRVDWMPFGGHQSSGLGRGGIPYTIEDMTIERLAVFRT